MEREYTALTAIRSSLNGDISKMRREVVRRHQVRCIARAYRHIATTIADFINGDAKQALLTAQASPKHVQEITAAMEDHMRRVLDAIAMDATDKCTA